ncbi:MAG: GNAT family N-acetyltransferase [Myxococcota bacterium]
MSAAAAIVREVTADDVPAVVAIVARVLAEHGIPFGVGSESDRQLSDLPAVYRDAGGRFWVAADGDGILGTCGVYPVGDGLLELRKMYLDARARGLGLGQRQHAEAIAFARASGAHHLVLDTVEQMTRAIAFYERHGFVRDDAQIRGARCSRGYALAL